MDSGGNDLERTRRRERADRGELPTQGGSEPTETPDSGTDRPKTKGMTNGGSDTDDVTETDADESGDSSSSRGWSWRIAMALRNGAFVLLPVGFIGLTVTDTWLTPEESPYSLVFAGGIICAIASIYLAIYQHEIDD
ncbi:hypothetical protein [Halostagnicola sp. A-GB9-2]|uniref:hypothetical protein n=1 Tax=Halostagnicola sp. A-GB9-2 TaxID=3048066 RepID=UPI0024C0A0AF|nr:hypothetical protein [Halostagnicola sp. A-GB9-2]MDJ1432140.1 hypothetical protein [Halostagnicola sp. A-GB9-2]